MVSPEIFVTCPACSCHAKASEIDCPHCGKFLRRNDGSIQRTAVAVLLGLTSAVSLSCGSSVDSGDTMSGGDGGQGGILLSSSASYGGGATFDVDGDGSDAIEAGGDDCNDADATIYPGAPETAGDGIDSNCNGKDDT